MSGRIAFEHASHFDCSAEELGAWHFRPGAIHRLVPPWESIEVLREAAPLVDGARAELVIRKWPLSLRMVAVHREVDPPRGFVDEQERGPFGSWRHSHRFEPENGGGSRLVDSIRFDPPFGAAGALLPKSLMLGELRRQFEFRHRRTRDDIARHAEIAARFGAAQLRVGVTGASGLVGRQLCAFLSTGGHEVVRFIRGTPRGPGERQWNPDDPAGGMAPSAVEDLDAVVHLAGEPIAAGRWNDERKRRIEQSRVRGTQAVARAIARAGRRPRVLVSASAIGYYGHRPGEQVDERSDAGSGFLPDVVRAWESATREAEDAGVRTVHLRVGVVLSAAGGALGKMLPAFRVGAGGPIGSGAQGFSWIALDDLLGAALFAVRNDALSGAVNAVAPAALPQRGFAGVLGRVLGRPSFAPLPAPVVRGMFGEMGQRLLLEGALVRPAVLETHGFRFACPSLEQALRLELGRLGFGSPGVGSLEMAASAGKGAT
ncbi:MAG: hypothetical protein RL325_269 [Planctomycetota bacterium]